MYESTCLYLRRTGMCDNLADWKLWHTDDRSEREYSFSCTDHLRDRIDSTVVYVEAYNGSERCEYDGSSRKEINRLRMNAVKENPKELRDVYG